MKKEDIQILVKRCVEILVSGNLLEIEQGGMNGRLSLEEIRYALDDYPGTLTLPPSDAYERMHIYDETPEGWQNVEFELWYNDSESDLTLSVRVRRTLERGELQILDIHVL